MQSNIYGGDEECKNLRTKETCIANKEVMTELTKENQTLCDFCPTDRSGVNMCGMLLKTWKTLHAVRLV